jgi:hypothetical protein
LGVGEEGAFPELTWVFRESRVTGKAFPETTVFLRDGSGGMYQVHSGAGPAWRVLSAEEYGSWGLPADTRMAAISQLADAGTILRATWDDGEVSALARTIGGGTGERRVARFRPGGPEAGAATGRDARAVVSGFSADR